MTAGEYNERKQKILLAIDKGWITKAQASQQLRKLREEYLSTPGGVVTPEWQLGLLKTLQYISTYQMPAKQTDMYFELPSLKQKKEGLELDLDNLRVDPDKLAAELDYEFLGILHKREL